MKTEEKKSRQIFIGEVVSDKMEKTIVVKTERTFKHPRFHKVLRRTKKYKVHDEAGESKMGDIVEFYEGRPVSKTKYMYFARVIKSRFV